MILKSKNYIETKTGFIGISSPLTAILVAFLAKDSGVHNSKGTFLFPSRYFK